ncbi:ABC transporter [Novosphingobium sp. FSW06-99]|nr:ABC transporter [Novosphingobium sp. FSW06-99]
MSLRELQQRFGRDNIGYLWVVAEPMMLASVITLLHAAVSKSGSGESSPFTFMLTGYSIYIIFRNSFNRAESSLHQSDNLFYHGMITPFDIVACKSLVETIGCVSALVVLQTVGIMLGVSELPFRPLYLMGAVSLFAWMAFAMSMIVAAYGYLYPLVGRLAHPFAYFALPVSGAFVSMSILPMWTHHFLSWNPMVSIFEMARYGQFKNASTKYFFIAYVVKINVVLTYWGLLEIRRIRTRIHVS